jgi:hypothetical protein
MICATKACQASGLPCQKYFGGERILYLAAFSIQYQHLSQPFFAFNRAEEKLLAIRNDFRDSFLTNGA